MSNVRSERVPGMSTPREEPAARRDAARRAVAGLRRPGRRALVQAGLVLMAAAAVAAGLYGLRVDRGGHAQAGIGDVIGVPNGEMRVDRVTYWKDDQHMRGMPGMKMSDPLPKGHRRFWIDVTMHATSSPGIRYAPNTFVLSAEGLGLVVPHWSPDGLETIVPGAQATVTFLYQVPDEQGDVVLNVTGSSESVVIPGPGSSDEGHGH